MQRTTRRPAPAGDAPVNATRDEPTVSVPPDDLFDLLDDQYARTILEATRDEARRARELIELCDASKPTVYRRLNRLEDAGLVTARQTYDPDGHHCQVFRATLDEIVVDVGPDGLRADVELSSPE
jgi:predicted transcriptional regulator